MIYPIYVMSHSDLFREGLNAVAAFCGSRGFQTATWIGSAMGILLTALAYVKQHDLLVYLRWFVTYVFVFNVLLGIPSTVSVINTSDQTVPPAVIDNVPFGVAFPAYLITTIGYGFTKDMETVFAMPEESEYHRTGMLFGSSLFRLSMSASIHHRDLLGVMEQYVKNCVVGDVLINHKYSWETLADSTDLWGLMTRNPSPIRGLFIDGVFATCQQAAKTLTEKMNAYAKDRAPGFLSRKIPSQHPYAASAINRYLVSSYQYFAKASQTATDIFRQNLAINLFRSGIQAYARETGSLTSLPVIANTEAMAKTRMAWATSRHIGIQTLPLMQVVLLLLLLCLFPLVALLTLLPAIGMNVFKQYVYSLLWLESWPILYAILNMAMNAYLHGRSVDSVTLANVNLLAQSHSDIAGIAGYLVLAIPFLSLGIVRGMAFTFNNAAQYLGGMMHSIAQSSAASVATGNYSLGNVSTDNATANNLNANKHDTNFTDLHGLNTQQLGNAALMTTTPMGDTLFNTSTAMSQLASQFNAAQSVSRSLLEQAGASIHHAYQHHTQYGNSRGHNAALGTGFATSETARVNQSMEMINNLTRQVAQREGVSMEDAFRGLWELAFHAKASVTLGTGFRLLGNGGTVEGSASIGVSKTGAISNNTAYSTGVENSVSTSDVENFKTAVDNVKDYAKTHSFSDQNTEAQNLAIQTGSDFSEVEQLSRHAQWVEGHTDSVNTNFTQQFVDYVQNRYPEEATAILSATGDSALLKRQLTLMNEFIKPYESELLAQHDRDSASIQNEPIATASTQKQFREHYAQTQQEVLSKGDSLFSPLEKSDTIKGTVNNSLNKISDQNHKGHHRLEQYSHQLQRESAQKITQGKSYVDLWNFSEKIRPDIHVPYATSRASWGVINNALVDVKPLVKSVDHFNGVSQEIQAEMHQLDKTFSKEDKEAEEQ